MFIIIIIIIVFIITIINIVLLFLLLLLLILSILLMKMLNKTSYCVSLRFAAIDFTLSVSLPVIFTILANQQSVSFDFTPIDDQQVEIATEMVSLNIDRVNDDVSGLEIPVPRSIARITIEDNEGMDNYKNTKCISIAILEENRLILNLCI